MFAPLLHRCYCFLILSLLLLLDSAGSVVVDDGSVPALAIRIVEPASGAEIDTDTADVSIVVTTGRGPLLPSWSLCFFCGGLLMDCVDLSAFPAAAAVAAQRRLTLGFEFGPHRSALGDRPLRVHAELRDAARGVVLATAPAVTYWMVAAAAPAPAGGLSIALHAQRLFSRHSVVAGSEVTCRGMRAALEALPSVGHVSLFGPFDYAGLASRRYDVVIIEGYVASVPAFIAAARALNPDVVVMYLVLDTYPTALAAMRIDADGFLTNSRVLVCTRARRRAGDVSHHHRVVVAQAESLSSLLPTQFMLLAADPQVMRPGRGGGVPSHEVVYVGQMSIHKARCLLAVVCAGGTCACTSACVCMRAHVCVSCSARARTHVRTIARREI
jgi:hypothetical protein